MKIHSDGAREPSYHSTLRSAQAHISGRHFGLLHGGHAVPIDVHADKVGVPILPIVFGLQRRHIVAYTNLTLKI